MSRTLSGVCAAMSTPTEKARSEPAKTIVPISVRASTCSSALRSSSIIGMSMTFRGGLFSTTRATGGCSATVMRVKPVCVPVVMNVPPLATADPLGFARGRHFDFVRFAQRSAEKHLPRRTRSFGFYIGLAPSPRGTQVGSCYPSAKLLTYVLLQCGHERVRPVASEEAGLRLEPFALGPPPVSDPRLRFGSRRGFQSPAFSARTPRKKISLISRAMVSAPGSTRGLYHVYSQFII